jgi:hypothetical protein
MGLETIHYWLIYRRSEYQLSGQDETTFETLIDRHDEDRFYNPRKAVVDKKQLRDAIISNFQKTFIDDLPVTLSWINRTVPYVSTGESTSCWTHS